MLLRVLASLVVSAVAARVLVATAAPPAPAMPELLRMAGAYVRHFEDAFAVVVSDEEYEQRLIGRASDLPVTRRTNAEMLFLWRPDERVWLSVRNVLRVANGSA